MPDQFTYFIGCQVQKQEGNVNGCYRSLQDEFWMPEDSKDYAFHEGPRTKKTMHVQSVKGLKIRAPKDFKLDDDVQGIPQSCVIGIYDERTHTINPESAIHVAMDKRGKFSADTSAKLAKLVSSGSGKIGYSFFLPCARITTTQKVGPQKGSFVSGVIVGASVQGNICFDKFGDDGSNAAVNALSGKSKGNVIAKKSIVGAFEQVGGLAIKQSGWSNRRFSKFLNYLQGKWSKKTLKDPKTWTVQRFIVRDDANATQDELMIHTKEENLLHQVYVLG